MSTDKQKMRSLALRCGAMVGELALMPVPQRTKCPACNGTGQRIEHALTVRRCMTCEGRGRVLLRDSQRPNKADMASSRE